MLGHGSHPQVWSSDTPNLGRWLSSVNNVCGKYTYFHDEAACWEQYAYDPSEQPVDGKRNREWTATTPTEVGVVLEPARCLTEIGEGHWPR